MYIQIWLRPVILDAAPHFSSVLSLICTSNYVQSLHCYCPFISISTFKKLIIYFLNRLINCFVLAYGTVLLAFLTEFVLELIKFSQSFITLLVKQYVLSKSIQRCLLSKYLRCSSRTGMAGAVPIIFISTACNIQNSCQK